MLPAERSRNWNELVIEARNVPKSERSGKPATSCDNRCVPLLGNELASTGGVVWKSSVAAVSKRRNFGARSKAADPLRTSPLRLDSPAFNDRNMATIPFVCEEPRWNWVSIVSDTHPDHSLYSRELDFDKELMKCARTRDEDFAIGHMTELFHRVFVENAINSQGLITFASQERNVVPRSERAARGRRAVAGGSERGVALVTDPDLYGRSNRGMLFPALRSRLIRPIAPSGRFFQVLQAGTNGVHHVRQSLFVVRWR